MNEIPFQKSQITAMSNISKHYSSYLKKAVSNYPYARKFILSAQTDLHLAQVIEKQKSKELISQEIFHIQQSVEKFTKAYSLIFGSVSRKAMRDISHQSGKAFVKALRNMDMNKIFDNLKKVSPLIFEDSELKSLSFMNLNKKAEEMEKLLITEEVSKWDFKEVLDSFEKVRLDTSIALTSRSFNSWFYRGFTKLFRPLIKKFWNQKLLNEQKSIFIAQYDLLCFLYPLVFMTQKHEITSRYPSYKDSEVSPEDYASETLPIVKERARILSGLEKIDERISFLSGLLKKISDLPPAEQERLFKKMFGDTIKNS